jgi:pimeloyl-ACP methyl ester carboxylesterase
MAALSSIRECAIPPGDARISYLEAGEGPVLLLLHGIGSGARSWCAQLLKLADMHRVIAWNAPGYDVSTPLEADSPITQNYADSVRAFLDALSIKQCDIAGHSLGALMAVRFACAFPAYVRSLTLAGCAIGHALMEPAERRRLLESRIGDVVELGPRGMAEKRGPRLVSTQASAALARSVVDTMADIHPRGYMQAARMLSTGDMLSDLVMMPPEMRVQFIYGTADVITPPDVNLRAAAVRPKAQVHAIEGAGHALYVECADEFNAILRSFTGADHGGR